ncbi:sulfite exporter TauE/SafE family protein [Dyella sp. ASV21]|uniref:sulfite exporter TauE/SafE family protein n=1 Tax=Dyella sp. ASV21 TaxID=2795114 RepID=UPI0018ECFF05|nr:sulfite exporter TauE/SafE family protein [Dyella sp. ASV21]
MLPWFFLLIGSGLAAFTISALSGGGAGLMLLPILRLGLPAAQVPAALSIGTAVSSASRIALFFRHIHWPVVRWFVPAAMPCVWLGAWLLTYVEPAYLEAALGLFLLGNLPMLLRRTAPVAVSHEQPRWTLALIGGAAGFVSGLTGAVGLIFNRFYLSYGLSKEQVIATRAANEIILHLIKLLLYGLFGLLTPEVLGAGAAVALAALMASWVSRRVLPYLSEVLFKRIGYAAMVLSGVFMCSNATAVLADRHQVALTGSASRQGFQTRLDWAETRLTMEFKYQEGFEFEQVIDWSELPLDQQQRAASLIKAADRVVVEEVRTLRQRSYELYVYRDGQLDKYKL